jgi:hypothetical protein
MSLKIEFFLKKEDSNRIEKPIYAKVKYNSDIVEFPLGKTTNELNFNQTTQSEEISNFLKSMRQSITATYNQMAINKETVTAEKIKNKFLKWNEENK